MYWPTVCICFAFVALATLWYVVDARYQELRRRRRVAQQRAKLDAMPRVHFARTPASPLSPISTKLEKVDLPERDA